MRVVIVEDEGMVAALLENMLSDLGHQVVGVAGRMDRAERLLSSLVADVVILDVNLDGERTYSLASALASRGISVVFATGYGSEGLEEAWRRAPVLQKPFRASELDRAIRQAIGAGQTEFAGSAF